MSFYRQKRVCALQIGRPGLQPLNFKGDIIVNYYCKILISFEGPQFVHEGSCTRWMCDDGRHAVPFWIKDLIPPFCFLQFNRGRGEMDPNREPPMKRDRSRSAAKSSAESAPKRLRLEVTSGIMAAGAWKARFEIAEMLESGANPRDVVTLIRSGEEGKEIEGSGPRTDFGSMTPGSHVTEDESGFEDWDVIKATQRSIVEAVGGNEDVLPPWARSSEATFRPSGTSTGWKSEAFRSYKPEPPQVVEPPRELFGERKPSVLTFGKRAKPPPSGPPPESTLGNRGPEAGLRSQSSPAEDAAEVPSFRKRAVPPPHEMDLRGKELGHTGPRTSEV